MRDWFISSLEQGNMRDWFASLGSKEIWGITVRSCVGRESVLKGRESWISKKIVKKKKKIV